MTHTYHISGMTCGSCEAKVRNSFLKLPGISNVTVSKEQQSATITMEKHVPISILQESLDAKYSISANEQIKSAEEATSWLETYKPVLLIFVYITGITLLLQYQNDQLNYMDGMRHFMAGFFLVFSFFKLLNLKGFAESYAMYDVVAKRFSAWGYVYAFVELGLGIAFLLNLDPFVTNLITLIMMSLSIIGVLQSVMNKKKIQCACLGAVFNLPMSTITIIEDGLMIGMSAIMLFML